jgi:heptosyltransferase I
VNILIIKLSAIGDVVQSLPFLETLRNTFPGARIDWVVEEPSSQILLGHPAIDRVIVSQRKTWQKKMLVPADRILVLNQIYRFLSELRRYRYDWIIDLQGLFKSGVITGLAKGGRKVGMSGSREGARLFLNEPAVPVDYEHHAVDRYLKVAEYLGCDPVGRCSPVPFAEPERQAVDRLLEQAAADKRPLVAVNPMAKWPTKIWEIDRFAAVASRVARELGAAIVFTGSDNDRAVIHRAVGMMPDPPLNLAGRTTLKQLAYLYTRCRVLVTTDTGPMHIAAAMGCPVVALFGPTAPWRTGPYGDGHTVISSGMGCSPCFKKRCDHMTCMKEIGVDQVVEAVRRVLAP